MHVRIYRAAKSAMQSGRVCVKQWRIEPEPAFPGDTLAQVRLRFASAEDAVRCAEREKWSYEIESPCDRRVTPRSYMDSFRGR